MTHDHEAAQLAVASLDFELTPGERTRMEAGLATCAECAAIAASHVQIQGMLQQLPVHDASAIVRQRVMRAALVPPRTSQWQLLLVAAALLGLLMAGALAVGAFRNDPPERITDVPPSPPQALGDIESPQPSQSVDPSIPASAPASDPGSLGISDPTTGEQILLKAVPADLAATCVRSRTDASGTEIQGDMAGLDCPVGAGDIVESRYFLFASTSQLDGWWQSGMKERHLQPDSGGCTNGREGETVYDGGRLQCFKVTVGTRLRWSDEKRRIYGVVVASGDDIGPAVDWWARAHGVSGVRADPDFTAIEQELVDEAAADIADVCIPYRIVGPEAVQVEDSVGAVDCLVESSLVADVGYFRFPTRAALSAWWDQRLVGLPVKADSGGCLDGTAGETKIGRVRLACYVTDGEARIRWTDPDHRIYGALNGKTTDIARLFRWWNDRH